MEKMWAIEVDRYKSLNIDKCEKQSPKRFFNWNSGRKEDTKKPNVYFPLPSACRVQQGTHVKLLRERIMGKINASKRENDNMRVQAEILKHKMQSLRNSAVLGLLKRPEYDTVEAGTNFHKQINTTCLSNQSRNQVHRQTVGPHGRGLVPADNLISREKPDNSVSREKSVCLLKPVPSLDCKHVASQLTAKTNNLGGEFELNNMPKFNLVPTNSVVSNFVDPSRMVWLNAHNSQKVQTSNSVLNQNENAPDKDRKELGSLKIWNRPQNIMKQNDDISPKIPHFKLTEMAQDIQRRSAPALQLLAHTSNESPTVSSTPHFKSAFSEKHQKRSGDKSVKTPKRTFSTKQTKTRNRKSSSGEIRKKKKTSHSKCIIDNTSQNDGGQIIACNDTTETNSLGVETGVEETGVVDKINANSANIQTASPIHANSENETVSLNKADDGNLDIQIVSVYSMNSKEEASVKNDNSCRNLGEHRQNIVNVPGVNNHSSVRLSDQCSVDDDPRSGFNLQKANYSVASVCSDFDVPQRPRLHADDCSNEKYKAIDCDSIGETPATEQNCLQRKNELQTKFYCKNVFSGAQTNYGSEVLFSTTTGSSGVNNVVKMPLRNSKVSDVPMSQSFERTMRTKCSAKTFAKKTVPNIQMNEISRNKNIQSALACKFKVSSRVDGCEIYDNGQKCYMSANEASKEKFRKVDKTFSITNGSSDVCMVKNSPAKKDLAGRILKCLKDKATREKMSSMINKSYLGSKSVEKVEIGSQSTFLAKNDFTEKNPTYTSTNCCGNQKSALNQKKQKPRFIEIRPKPLTSSHFLKAACFLFAPNEINITQNEKKNFKKICTSLREIPLTIRKDINDNGRTSTATGKLVHGERSTLNAERTCPVTFTATTYNGDYNGLSKCSYKQSRVTPQTDILSEPINGSVTNDNVTLGRVSNSMQIPVKFCSFVNQRTSEFECMQQLYKSITNTSVTDNGCKDNLSSTKSSSAIGIKLEPEDTDIGELHLRKASPDNENNLDVSWIKTEPLDNPADVEKQEKTKKSSCDHEVRKSSDILKYSSKQEGHTTHLRRFTDTANVCGILNNQQSKADLDNIRICGSYTGITEIDANQNLIKVHCGITQTSGMSKCYPVASATNSVQPSFNVSNQSIYSPVGLPQAYLLQQCYQRPVYNRMGMQTHTYCTFENSAAADTCTIQAVTTPLLSTTTDGSSALQSTQIKPATYSVRSSSARRNTVSRVGITFATRKLTSVKKNMTKIMRLIRTLESSSTGQRDVTQHKIKVLKKLLDMKTKVAKKLVSYLREHGAIDNGQS